MNASAHPRHAATMKRGLPWSAITAFFIVVAVIAVGGAWAARGTTQAGSQSEEPATSTQQAPSGATEAHTPDAVDVLLSEARDPDACAVTFTDDIVDIDPVLERRGVLYQNLPTPESADRVFAGWYLTEEAASDLDQTARMNGSRQADCGDNQRQTLYGAWVTPEQNEAEEAQIPILMYHWFTTNPDGEDNYLRGNYVYIDDFEAHLKYISDQQFYLPTWPELDAFLDGKLFLPSHSVIVTDDDAKASWVNLAVPLVDKYQVMTTSFVIASKGAGDDLSQHVLKRSHTYDMHSAGEDGQGRMVNWSAEEIAADLEKSAEVVGAKEVLAYPFGHFNDTAKEGIRKAGFDLARTTAYGYVSLGTDKLELPCVRIDYGMGVEALQAAIG